MNWIQSVLESKRRLAIPVMTHPGIETLGYTVREAVTDGEKQYRAMQWLSDNYPADAATAIMDLTLEAEAFGATVHFPEEEIPSVTGRLVCDYDSVAALAVPSLEVGRVPEYLKANRLAVEHIHNKPILSGCIGPYSLAGRLYDMSELMLGIYMEPDTIQLLLSKCTDFLIDYCRALKATGTQGVIMAEPAAGLLSDDDCREFSSRYVQRVVEAVQDEDFTVVLHNCGNSGQCTDAMIASRAAALHFGNAIDLNEVLRTCPPNVVVMGNLDPVSLFQQSTPAALATAVDHLLQSTAAYPNLVLSSGCDLPPRVPTANLQAFFEAVKRFNQKR